MCVASATTTAVAADPVAAASIRSFLFLLFGPPLVVASGASFWGLRQSKGFLVWNRLRYSVPLAALARHCQFRANTRETILIWLHSRSVGRSVSRSLLQKDGNDKESECRRGRSLGLATEATDWLRISLR